MVLSRTLQKYLVNLCLAILLLGTPSAFIIPHAEAQAPASVLPVAPKQTDIFNPNSVTNNAPSSGQRNINLLQAGPARLMTLVLGLFSAISIVIAIYAGAVIIFSDGDMKKIETAVKTLLYAALGMLLVGGAWLIVRFVLNIDLTTVW